MRRRSLPTLLGLLLAASLAGCSIGGSASSTPTTAATTTTASAATTAATAVATAPRATGATPAATRTAGTAGAATPRATATRASTAATPLPTLASGQTYTDPQGRFSFTIPSNWTPVQAAGAEVAFQSPVQGNAIPGTVNIVLERLPSAAVTLDEYDQAGEQNLKQQFPDYKPISLNRVTIDGKQAYKRVYTATIAGRLLQLQQIYLIDRDVAYVISCGAPQDTFNTYTTVFDQISGTFKVGTGR